MNFNVFTLHPALFESFKSEGLIARAISKDIIAINTINWRQKYGVGGYKQVDDRPYGGGTGMVLQAEQIYQALSEYKAVSPLFNPPSPQAEYSREFPRNDTYFEFWKKQSASGSAPRSLTVSLTPRGYQLTQPVVEWMSKEFDSINFVCGRYEGFDSRASELFDLELSLGPYVVNGGEVPAMVMIEAVARLLPEFVTKNPSVMHDSFSSAVNKYDEMEDFVIGTRRKLQLISAGDPNNKLGKNKNQEPYPNNLFDKEKYLREVAPFVEHTQFTRPADWRGFLVPEILLKGDHKAIQKWRSVKAD